MRKESSEKVTVWTSGRRATPDRTELLTVAAMGMGVSPKCVFPVLLGSPVLAAHTARREGRAGPFVTVGACLRSWPSLTSLRNGRTVEKICAGVEDRNLLRCGKSTCGY